MGEVVIGLISGTLYPTTQVVVVYFWVSYFLLVLLEKNFMVMREVDICLRPDTFLPLTQVFKGRFTCRAVASHPVEKVYMVMRGVI